MLLKKYTRDYDAKSVQRTHESGVDTNFLCARKYFVVRSNQSTKQLIAIMQTMHTNQIFFLACSYKKLAGFTESERTII